jgi:hypothetical protein
MTEPFHYRNADGSLRLDELLGERCVRHYTRILSSSNEQFAAMQLAMAPAEAEDVPDTWMPWQEPLQGVRTPEGWVVAPRGAAEREASSCQELAPLPAFVWDVCGYYRRLGVPWRATRTQIRLAYLAKDPMSRSEPLHYAMTQLLDPLIRRAYDLMPLGGLFMGDREVRELIERQAAMAASARNAEAFFDDEHVSQDDVLKEWGFEKGLSEEEARERLDGGFRHGRGSDELGSSLSDWETSWGWYWMSDPDDCWTGEPCEDIALLETWQAMVASALTAAGVRTRFAVGIWHGNGARSWRDGNKGCIFFIGRGRCTQREATEAVRAYIVKENTRATRESRDLCRSSTRAQKRPSGSPTRTSAAAVSGSSSS